MFSLKNTSRVVENYIDGPFCFKWNKECVYSQTEFGTFFNPVRKHLQNVHGKHFRDKDFEFVFLSEMKKANNPGKKNV